MATTQRSIDFIAYDQMKISAFASKLDNDIKINNSDVLAALVLNNESSHTAMNFSFYNIKKDVVQIDDLLETLKLQSPELKERLNIIKRRVVAYETLNNSLGAVLQRGDKEEIKDALLEFNSINKKFTQDTGALVDLVKQELIKEIEELKSFSDDMKVRILLSFFTSFIIILFTLYKLVSLNRKVNIQLKRAEDAQKEQGYLRAELAKYNEDLEAEIEKKTAQLHSKIYTNHISSLPNRNQLLLDMHKHKFSTLAILDIDKFQQFNDIYGEEMGNNVLRLSADFIKRFVLEYGCEVYHISGDEFVVAQKEQIGSKTDFITMIEDLLERYKQNVFRYEEKSFNINISAGLSFSGDAKMLAYADMALKDAKKRNISIEVFAEDKKIEEEHIKILDCYNTLLRSFENNGVISYFQPIVPLQEGAKATKYESLVRLFDRDEIIAPSLFIDVAKKHRLYEKLTRKVIENTLHVIKNYQVPSSINISVDDITNKSTLDFIYKQLELFSYNHLLTIELLETEDFKDYEEVVNFCKKVRSYGAKIALDDFGSGYSNFSHALNLPIDYIKIDASLISNIDRDKNSQIMVQTIVELAKKMNVQTIAEFVSSVKIYETVKSLGVDYGQGFYIGKPEPITFYIK